MSLFAALVVVMAGSRLLFNSVGVDLFSGFESLEDETQKLGRCVVWEFSRHDQQT